MECACGIHYSDDPTHWEGLLRDNGPKNSMSRYTAVYVSTCPTCATPGIKIFADTQAEPQHVYDTLNWLEQLVSFPIIQTSWGDLSANTWKALRGEPVPERGHYGSAYIDLPVFSATGLSRRQCTTIYKIRPIKAKIRELTGLHPNRLDVTQYLGISVNESRRAKPSRDRWITNRYPLIEAGWDRKDLLTFLDDNFEGHPIRRSACWFCPFHTNAEWKEIRDLYPDLYEDALNMERAMADHPRGPWYLKSGGLEKTMARLDNQLALPLIPA